MSLQLDSASSGACSRPAGRGVSLRRVFAQQDYGSLLSTVLICVALLVTSAALDGPRARPFLVTDATISFPHNASTVPYWVAIVASVAAALLSILVLELGLLRRLYADASDALASVLHLTIDCLSAFFVTGLATTVIKMVVGRLRPDFLDRCQPVVPNPLTTSYGLPPADNPACTAQPSSELTDGHYSFPSGHTSTVFVFATWTGGYCIWALNMRVRRSARDILARSLAQRLLCELGTAAGFMWIVAQLAFAWGVGVSRITDFKHHPSDVAAGALLGSLFGVAFVVRGIARLDRVLLTPAAMPAAGAACGPGDASPQADTSLLHADNRVRHAGTSSADVGV